MPGPDVTGLSLTCVDESLTILTILTVLTAPFCFRAKQEDASGSGDRHVRAAPGHAHSAGEGPSVTSSLNVAPGSALGTAERTP